MKFFIILLVASLAAAELNDSKDEKDARAMVDPGLVMDAPGN